MYCYYLCVTSMNSTDIAFLFGEVARLTRRRFNQQMESFRLTHAQSRTLLRLSRCQGLRQVDLAKILEIQPITLVKQLDQLVEMGLIERRNDEQDRRAFRLYLLPAAEPVLTDIRAEVQELQSLMTKDLTAAQIAAFVEALLVMKTNLLSEDIDTTHSAMLGKEDNHE